MLQRWQRCRCQSRCPRRACLMGRPPPARPLRAALPRLGLRQLQRRQRPLAWRRALLHRLQRGRLLRQGRSAKSLIWFQGLLESSERYSLQ